MPTKIPPIPYKSPMTDDTKTITAIWADWFKQALVRMGGPKADSNDELTAEVVAISSTKLLSSSGYQKIGSGLYVQWGVTASLVSATTNVITFPIAFPTACLQVIAGVRDCAGASTADTGRYGTGTYTTTTFELYNRTSADYLFNWMAVGS